MSQHSLDAFESTAGKPPITLLESDLTRCKDRSTRAYVAAFANVILLIYHFLEHGVSDVT
jgi:hypothetical protein